MLLAIGLSITIPVSVAAKSLPPMRRWSKYERGLLLFLAVVIFPTVKTATGTDARSQPATAATVAHDMHDVHAGGEIPTGFKLERYARVWEHNPFTLVTPALPQAKLSPFDKLFLTSWLKDGRTDVIFIQNSETNEVQKITAEPNQNNLRLIALHLNAYPQFVEAVISDGKEQGPVKFRFDVQSSAGQMPSSVARIPNGGAPGQAPNPAQLAPGALPRPQANPPNAQTSALPATAPVDQPLTRPIDSGTPRVQMQGGPKGAPRGRESEGERLLPPQTSGKSISGKG